MTSAHNIYSPLKKEWGIFVLLMLGLAALLSYPAGLGQVDRFIYDNLIKATQRPASEDIAIIAIDDVSLASIGRWPWSRATHSILLNILAGADVNAIGMDIIFSEPSTVPEDDVLLASAIAKTRRTVLPVLIERTASGPKTTLPLPELKAAAKNLGHIHFTFDADGIVRSVYMQESLHGVSWPQFALSVFNTGKGNDDLNNAGAYPDSSNTENVDDTENTILSHIFKNHTLERIPFAGAPGHFKTVSYVDVLSGKIPANYFTDKYVLIGAIAAGVAPTFSTSVTTDHRAMSGVEINANILAGLIEGRSIHDAARWAIMLFTLAATVLAMAACRTFSPFIALGLSALLLALISGFTYFIFTAGVWIPPAAAILMVIAVYPLWNWRRLEAALNFLSEEFMRLNQNTAIVLRNNDISIKPKNSDFLDKQITAMRIAADRSRDMHQFVIDNLNSMPDATLVLSPSGELLMVNRVARKYFASIGFKASDEPTLDRIFEKFEPYFETNAKRSSWRDVLLQPTAAHEVVEIETRDINKREFLVKSAPSCMADNSMLGWIVSLIDVTTLRAAERRREESLNFISHDMRVPQSSILALIQLQKNPDTAFPLPEFLGRIEKSVETTLNLADNFVHLAKAESQAYQLQDADFPSILADAADDMWAFAHSKSIAIIINAQVENYWINVDRSLLVRAIGNLLSNAIKFSPPGSQVVCTAKPVQTDSGGYIICSISDQGKGIGASEHTAIFSPFQRAAEQGRDGIGLGLAFVKMVIERHGGTIDVNSVLGKGSIFTVTLPCVIEANEI